MQQATAEVRIEPLELDSIFVRRGLVGLFLAPPDYGVLPHVGCTLAESVNAPEIGAHVIEPFPCFFAVRGRPQGTAVVAGREDLDIEALRAEEALDESYLFIQGPPRAGKTTIGSRLIVELLHAGKRVGVTSNSHKVVHNVLDAVEERANFKFEGVKKSSSNDIDSTYESAHIRSVRTNDDALATGAQLVAGTAWLFADPAFEGSIDYLFVDEAGRVSLAARRTP